jgi:ABC-type antimicrobial peptide transport system permease subunit
MLSLKPPKRLCLFESGISNFSATDPWTFGAVIALILIVGVAACAVPARYATGVDPLVALRYE